MDAVFLRVIIVREPQRAPPVILQLSPQYQVGSVLLRDFKVPVKKKPVNNRVARVNFQKREIDVPSVFFRKTDVVDERLNMDGILVIASPYTWLEEFTRRENWVGGIRKDGEPYTTLDGLKDLLADHFQMIDDPRDVEFVIRETRRKFQHTVSQLTAWKRIK